MHVDFHIHSCLSPCGDADMTPHNIVNMARMNGLDAVALTDHNSCGNCRACVNVGAAAGLLVLPGMELTTAEEIHVLCLFPELNAAEDFSGLVYSRLPPIKNRPDIYGPQVFMDEHDRVTGTEPRLLSNATGIALWELPALLADYGAAGVYAHIRRPANGILSILGDITPDMGLSLAELSAGDDRERYQARFPFLRFLRGSDAHVLWDIAEAGPDFCLPDESPSGPAPPGGLLSAGDAHALIRRLLYWNSTHK